MPTTRPLPPPDAAITGLQAPQSDGLLMAKDWYDYFRRLENAASGGDATFESVTITPPTSTLEHALDIAQFLQVPGAGSIAGPTNANFINIGDISNITGAVPNINGIQYNYQYFGGPDAGGAHQALAILCQFAGAGPTPVTDNVHPAFQGMSLFVAADQSWGGSVGTPKGDLYGGQWEVDANNGAVGLDHCEAMEFDNNMRGTATARIRTVLSLLRGGDDIHGTLIDSCAVIGTSDATSGGWREGINFYNGIGNPIHPTLGTLIRAETAVGAPQPYAALHGLDFSAVTFAGNFLNGAGWRIDGNGKMHFTLAALTNAANDGAAAGAGVAVGQVYRNGSVLMVRVA